MKNAFALSVGLLALAAVPAAAADIPMKAPIMAPVAAPIYNWSGCYIGGNAGGKWASTRDDVNIGAVTGSPAVTSSFDRATASSFIGGGQIGCNMQSGNWVFGLEGDADWHRWSTTRVQPVTLPPLVVGDVFDVSSDWQASARGRIGYAFDRTLLYLTGGAAFTNVQVGTFFPVFVGSVVFPASAATDTKTLFGATLGAGIEYALSNNWSVGVEGRYSWYGTHTFSGGTVAAIPAVGGGFLFAPATQTLKIETLEVTGRLNYRFNWGGPVVARY
jgi:outer membrane immunogenic protein